MKKLILLGVSILSLFIVTPGFAVIPPQTLCIYCPAGVDPTKACLFSVKAENHEINGGTVIVNAGEVKALNVTPGDFVTVSVNVLGTSIAEFSLVKSDADIKNGILPIPSTVVVGGYTTGSETTGPHIISIQPGVCESN